MKILAGIFLLACFCSAQARAQSNLAIGTDIISGLALNTLRIYGSHGFHNNCSATIEAGIYLGMMHNNSNILDKEHQDGIGNLTTPESHGLRKNFSTLCVHLDYWPQKTYRGPHIFLGGLLRDRTGPDILIGLGYCIPVWKGLGIDLKYQIGIIETYNTDSLPTEGIRGGFHYVF